MEKKTFAGTDVLGNSLKTENPGLALEQPVTVNTTRLKTHKVNNCQSKVIYIHWCILLKQAIKGVSRSRWQFHCKMKTRLSVYQTKTARSCLTPPFAH